MVIPAKYKPQFEQVEISIQDVDGWIPLDLTSLAKTPSAALITCSTAVGEENDVLFTYYNGDTDPGNDKKPNLFGSQYVFVQGAQQIKNLWFRKLTSGVASIRLIFFTT